MLIYVPFKFPEDGQTATLSTDDEDFVTFVDQISRGELSVEHDPLDVSFVPSRAVLNAISSNGLRAPSVRILMRRHLVSVNV